MIFGAYVAASILYLGWRSLCTLNPESPVYSALFLLFEAYATGCSVLFYAIILDRPRPRPLAPVQGLSVDVFICTYNESIDLLRQTIRRAMAMDYPHETWLLDDGRRPEAQRLAEELGCRYLTRSDNAHFKAGNLNNALSHSTADLVMVLDADHLVRPHFLTRLIGYFADPKVAIVQTPQVYYNIDSFQHHFDARRRRLWHEGAIFHHAMQPGAERWGAAFFVGTGAVLRRDALESVGGFATESVTEDAFTCMRLHAQGYRSVYHDEPLAYLLAPDSLLQYLTQRLRWGQGSMQILRLDNPLTKPGLSWQQRIVYFAALSSFAQAIVHLSYYLAPALFLLGGPAPLHVDHAAEFAPILGHILVDLVMFKVFLGSLARPLLSECFKFLNVYAFLKSTHGYFSRKRLKFAVTPKGRDTGASLQLLLPQLLLFLLNLSAFGHGMLTLVFAPSPNAVHTLGIAVATFFSGMFCLVGAMTIVYAHERIAAREEYTFSDHIDGHVRLRDERQVDAIVVRGNETELHLVLHESPGELPVGETIELSLALQDAAEPLHLDARVEKLIASDGAWILRVSLGEPPTFARDRLCDRFATVAIPAMVDPLVATWHESPVASEATALNPYYLPKEPTVL